MSKALRAALVILCACSYLYATVTAGNHVSAGSSDTTNVTTAAISTTSATLIVGCNVSGSSSPTFTSTSPSEMFTPLTLRSGAVLRAKLFYVYSPTGGGSQTFSAVNAAAFPAIVSMAFTKTKTAATPFDAETGATGTGTSASLTLTNSQTTNLDVICVGFDTVTSSIAATGYTKIEQVDTDGATHYGVTLLYKIGVAASESPGLAWTTSSEYAAAMASFKCGDCVAMRRTLGGKIASRQVYR